MSLEVSTSQIKNGIEWVIRKNDSIRLSSWLVILLTAWLLSILIVIISFPMSLEQFALASHWTDWAVKATLSATLLNIAGLLAFPGMLVILVVYIVFGVDGGKTSWVHTIITYPILFTLWWGGMWFVQMLTIVGLNAMLITKGITMDTSMIEALLNVNGFLSSIIFPAYVVVYIILAVYETLNDWWEERKCQQSTL